MFVALFATLALALSPPPPALGANPTPPPPADAIVAPAEVEGALDHKAERYRLEVRRLEIEKLIRAIETGACSEVKNRLLDREADLAAAEASLAFKDDGRVRQMRVSDLTEIANLKARALEAGEGLPELRDELDRVWQQIYALNPPSTESSATPASLTTSTYVLPTLSWQLGLCFPFEAKPKPADE